MNKTIFVLVLILILTVSGCATTAIPSSLPIETSTPLPQPTVVSSPTTIPSPSAVVPTAEPPLKTNGPYFTYFRQVNEVYQLVMMDADGGGRKAIELPQGFVDSLTNQYGLDMKFVSPDGKWLAFYTGTAGDYTKLPTQGTSDLTLNLMDLGTGETQIVTPLLSKDYPNNFVEAAKKLNDPNTTEESLYQAFFNGITNAISWSPDGRYLAFAGQMDGLSSDLYVYDITTKTIQRLSSGDEELQWINWSPDGKWILHGSIYWIGEGTEYNIYAAAVDGSSIPQFDYGYEDGWLNFHQFLEYHDQNGIGKHELRLADVDSGKITKIWDGAFMDYKIYPGGRWMVIATLDKGLQLINLKTLKDISAPDSLPNPPDTFLRLEDGEVLPLDLQPFNIDKNISTSPDLKYWIVANNHEIKIYSSDITLTKEISIPRARAKISNVIWRSDSSGLILINGAHIYAVDISKGNIDLVESNLINDNSSTYKWINGQ